MKLASLLAALVLASCAAGTEPASEGRDEALATAAFPPSFAFGTAIAGFQAEMGCPTVDAAACEDRASDWYQYITTPRILENPELHMSGDPPSKGPGFYELYDGDVARARELGSSVLRLSIEWSRVFPRPTWGITGHTALKEIASAEGLAYYRRVLASMRARGLRPSITLNHYTLPVWVHDAAQCNASLAECIAAGKGGWADPDRSRIVGEIAKYAGFVAEELGGEVDEWATMNEPLQAVVLAGYLIPTPTRTNPPGLFFQIDAARTATLAMIEAHARMYDAVKAADRVDADGDGRAADVGIVYAFSDVVPATDSAADARAAEHAHYLLHDMFMDAVVFGRVDERWDLGPGVAPVRPELAGRMDFVGVNYYFRFRAVSGPAFDILSPLLDFDPTTPLESTPRGISPVLARAAQRWQRPVIMTETGAIQDDTAAGAAWVVQSLDEVRRARAAGVDVRGFYAWTLMDNYEWNQGSRTRMGLYAVDPATKARSIRPSGRAFAEIARARTIPAPLLETYAGFFP